MNTTPTIELHPDPNVGHVAVLSVAGVSVTVGPDELHRLARAAVTARRALTDQEARDLWAADIERRLAVFDPAMIVRDEGITAEAIQPPPGPHRPARPGREVLATSTRGTSHPSRKENAMTDIETKVEHVRARDAAVDDENGGRA